MTITLLLRPRARRIRGVLACVIAVFAFAYGMPAAFAVAPDSKAFAFAGAPQTWTVPDGVTSVQVTVDGAQGGDGGGAMAYGGLGGRVQATLSVTPGEILQINVGGRNGFNGGGGGALAGGGASDVRRGAFGIADRVVVAGGGGGASGGNIVAAFGAGGSGGGPIASKGSDGIEDSSNGTGRGGEPGSQVAAGAGGMGALGGGGGSGAGGGGGGYFGGGGGGDPIWSHGGGGGGSSYVIPTATAIESHRGFHQGEGAIVVTWPPAPRPAPPTVVPASKAFTLVNHPEYWQVPQGVTAVKVVADGARGSDNTIGGPGGNGGRTTAIMTVTPGETIQINVGGRNGFNGGGGGAFASGGASDVRRGGVTANDRVLVAGGGGSPSTSSTGVEGSGGDGGGPIASKGGDGAGGDGEGKARGGEPGSQVAAGAGGVGYWTGSGNGSLGGGSAARVVPCSPST